MDAQGASAYGESLLGALAEALDFRALIEAGAQDVAGVFLPGSRLAIALTEQVAVALWERLRRRPEQEQRQVLDSLAGMPLERAGAVVDNALHTAGLSKAQKSLVAGFLVTVPMSVRQAVSRPGDGGRPATLASQLPRSRDDVHRFVPRSTPRFKAGDRIDGHDYALDRLLGQGGFAEVWKATHCVSAQHPPVALKFCLDPSLAGALKNELQLLSALGDAARQPHFVQLLHTAYSARPPFLVYEYVDGGDLVGWLADQGDEQPGLDRKMHVLGEIASALGMAHSRNIVHRDLKPANVLMTRQGQVKLADFGIGALLARLSASAAHAPDLTGATMIRGAHTPMYTSPEWSPGDPATPAVDVYAFGIIAWQLLAGDLLRAIPPSWQEELADREVPAEVIDLLSRCLTRADRRIADGLELSRQFSQLNSHQPAPREPKGRPANYCTDCGAAVDAQDKFCTRCGARVLA